MKGNEMRIKKMKPVKTYKFVFYNTITDEYSYGNKTPTEHMRSKGYNYNCFHKNRVGTIFYNLADEYGNALVPYKTVKLPESKIVQCLVIYLSDNLRKAMREKSRLYRIKKTPESERKHPYHLIDWYYDKSKSDIVKIRKQLNFWGKKYEEIKQSPEYLMELLRS